MIKKFSFNAYVPAEAVNYCQKLLQPNRFLFVIKGPRKTRLGDFTVRSGYLPRITVNGNLNPFNFLITYLHELAHLTVYEQLSAKGKPRPLPHGKEWKVAFQELMYPVLKEEVFPADILTALIKYIQNPKASTASDSVLYTVIKKYDKNQVEQNKVVLKHLDLGANFVFNNKVFIKGVARRTRILCTEKNSQRLFTIPAHALVETE